jgi:hypothetical protein
MTDLTPLSLHIANATSKGRGRRKLPRAYRFWAYVMALAAAAWAVAGALDLLFG